MAHTGRPRHGQRRRCGRVAHAPLAGMPDSAVRLRAPWRYGGARDEIRPASNERARLWASPSGAGRRLCSARTGCAAADRTAAGVTSRRCSTASSRPGSARARFPNRRDAAAWCQRPAASHGMMRRAAGSARQSAHSLHADGELAEQFGRCRRVQRAVQPKQLVLGRRPAQRRRQRDTRRGDRNAQPSGPPRTACGVRPSACSIDFRGQAFADERAQTAVVELRPRACVRRDPEFGSTCRDGPAVRAAGCCDLRAAPRNRRARRRLRAVASEVAGRGR